MSDLAIRCENLSKRYRIGSPERYRTLRDAISTTALLPFRRSKNNSQNGHGHIWALQDVGCEIKRGEVVGIIGLNGAGKSTLLRILSRITAPTRGVAEIYGRVGSLLEVGTGFHPELTGRENISLNGAILGMRKAEIARKFDEIVAFAEIEKFIDTPVKHYSSGMYMRLAFAVAAHLEPEILIVDEVLAVGDAEFQKKCLGKMGDVARGGRTVLFVSHNMAAVEALCSSTILLETGRLLNRGSSEAILKYYLQRNTKGNADVDLILHGGRTGKGTPVAKRFRIADGDGQLTCSISTGSDVRFQVQVSSSESLDDVSVAVLLRDSYGQVVMKCFTKYQWNVRITLMGEVWVTCHIKGCRLTP